MTVFNGQLGNQTSFNNAFISKTANSTGIAIYTLQNTDVASGAFISNLQAATNQSLINFPNPVQLSVAETIPVSIRLQSQTFLVQGDGLAVTMPTTPFGTTTPINGTELTIIGLSDTLTVKLTHNDIAFGCFLNGNCTLGRGDSITLTYSSFLNRFVEKSRNF